MPGMTSKEAFTMNTRTCLLTACALALTGSAALANTTSPQDQFIANLKSMCNRTLEGKLVTNDPADTDFAGQRLVMGPVDCAPAELRIPFAVGENRSRTWVITRTTEGIRLKHIHRHDADHEDTVSRYGGDTANAGTATRQEFPADAFSKELFMANRLERSVTNVWAVEAVPGKRFAYELRRANRFFRVEFDASAPAPQK
jgi:hypothetical protein